MTSAWGSDLCGLCGRGLAGLKIGPQVVFLTDKLELSTDISPVGFHRRLRDVQEGCDLSVGHAILDHGGIRSSVKAAR